MSSGTRAAHPGEPPTPKKAGDTTVCLRCHGLGYTRAGLTNDYPVECDRCQGTGQQTVRPR